VKNCYSSVEAFIFPGKESKEVFPLKLSPNALSS